MDGTPDATSLFHTPPAEYWGFRAQARRPRPRKRPAAGRGTEPRAEPAPSPSVLIAKPSPEKHWEMLRAFIRETGLGPEGGEKGWGGKELACFFTQSAKEQLRRSWARLHYRYLVLVGGECAGFAQILPTPLGPAGGPAAVGPAGGHTHQPTLVLTLAPAHERTEIALRAAEAALRAFWGGHPQAGVLFEIPAESGQYLRAMAAHLAERGHRVETRRQEDGGERHIFRRSQ